MTDKMVVVKIDADGKVVGVLAWINKRDGAWWCNPMVSGRKSSRKLWPTAEAAVPRWAKKYPGATLMSRDELNARLCEQTPTHAS